MREMAVAIINWNTRDLLRDCLRSVAAERPDEIVVVDNGSTDGSVAMVHAEFPQVIVEVRADNPGYGAAANTALQRCRAKYVLLLNSDTLLHGGTLEALTAALDAHPTAGLVGPRVINPDGSLQPSCFPFPGPAVPLMKRQPFAGLAGLVPSLALRFPVRFAHNRERQVPWVVGAVLAIRRAAFEAVDGFDETFHMYYEEVDLCYRLAGAGWATWFTPAATVVHLGGASTAQRRASMLLRLSRSERDFYRRHRHGASLAFALGVERVIVLGRLLRDELRHRIAAPGAGRDRLAEDVAVWREALRAPTRAS
jgi:N-acetylglucosaminyl-diphospho-decaprenol L-rhamnosyltransferase